MEFKDIQKSENNISMTMCDKALENKLNIYSNSIIKQLIKQGDLPSDKRIKSHINVSFNIEVADE